MTTTRKMPALGGHFPKFDHRALLREIKFPVQGGEDTLDAFSCRLIFANEPLAIGLFCGK